jgi:hypothetical protein
MKLYLLTGNSQGYDCAHGFVVRAPDEEQARRLAARECGDEGPRFWIAQRHTKCVELLPEGDAKVILRDFNAG